jgi:hypothetical protein
VMEDVLLKKHQYNKAIKAIILTNQF